MAFDGRARVSRSRGIGQRNASPLEKPQASVRNPYLDFFRSLPPSLHRDPRQPIDARELWVPDWLRLKAAIASHFSWAVPTQEALDAIRGCSREVVEIGAGSGYWAWMLHQSGTTVDAFDSEPSDFCWYSVQRGDEFHVRRFPERGLFLCWPPYGSPMASNALRFHRGDCVIFVGEWRGGCADQGFFSQLEAEYRIVRSVKLPQWFMRDDSLTIFRRK